MEEPIRMVVLGTGQMGCRIARLLLEKAGFKLSGLFARRPERAGLAVGPLLGHAEPLAPVVSNDLAGLIKQVRPQLAIQATCSQLCEAKEELVTLLSAGVSVISIAEELVFPAATSPELAHELDKLARSHDAAILGTGVNPGFVLDLLVIALTGVCSGIDSITARRINDLSPYGPTVLASQGVGLTPAEFDEGVACGRVVGHFGFPQSISMIGKALGLTIDRIEEVRRPIIAKKKRTTPLITVEPGRVAGCHHEARGFVDKEPLITLIHPQQVDPGAEGIATSDLIEIKGIPDLKLAIEPEIPGGLATAALAVNMIPQLLNAAPGLHTMADLPVPAAMLADVRKLVQARKQEAPHG